MEPTGCFKHNSVAFQVQHYKGGIGLPVMNFTKSDFIHVHFSQEGMYFRLGQLIRMAVVHGGAAMQIFCPSVLKYFSGMKPCVIIVDINEVPDASVREKLLKVLYHIIMQWIW